MRQIFLSFLILLGLVACQNFDYTSKGKDVPTMGNLVIGIDRGDSFLMVEEMDYFMDDYPKAKLHPQFLCEVALLRQLQMDSMRFVVMNRDFTKGEKENLERRDIKIRTIKIAETSIALIVNQQNPMDSISQAMLKEIFKGSRKNWNNGKEIGLVFDGSCGSNYEYFSRVFLQGKIEAPGIGSVPDPQKLINYVATHPNSIGFVGLNWISDRTESLSRDLSGKVKVLKVGNAAGNKYHLPFQSQIKAKEYPFIQSVYMHDLQGYTGLAKGFIAFVASQPGQILVKKSGLIPAHDFGRTIVIESE